MKVLSLKTYRRHNCSSQHRTARTFAKCVFRRAAWMVGDGPYALIAWCQVPTVSLWDTYEDALSSKRVIDEFGCGHACNATQRGSLASPVHEIAYLDTAQQEPRKASR